jgi:GntR family transcriptional regulator/MocR family aminotransferase
MVAPPQLLDSVIAAVTFANCQTATIDLLVVLDPLRTGELDRHVRLLRPHYRQRRSYLIDALAAKVRSVRVEEVAAELDVVIRLPEQGPSEAVVVQTALDRGLAMMGVSAFSAQWPERCHGPVIG